MKLNGIEIDFDFTAPVDMQNYRNATQDMLQAGEEIDVSFESFTSLQDMDKYIAFLNDTLNIYANFLDGTFGEGIAAQVLGARPALSTIAKINAEMGSAAEAQGIALGELFEPNKFNRAARRTR